MSEKTAPVGQSFGSITTRPLLLLIPVGIWVCALIVFNSIRGSTESLPPIASSGLADVYTFYFPLMVFTLIAIYLFTWKRDRPDWKGFALTRKTAAREVALTMGYLIVMHLILGSVFSIGLHFPGPNVFAVTTHGLADVFTWVAIQTIFFIIIPYLWLYSRGFRIRKLLAELNFKRDWWIILFFWCGDFFGVVSISDFGSVSPSDYATAIPFGIFVNTLGAGLPVLIMIHLIIIPRLSLLFNNQFLVILLGGFAYAMFSVFDPGTLYNNMDNATLTFAYILATQTLIGMGKAAFTVRTGNPVIHFTSYHILGARVAFDTAMFTAILK